MLKLWQRWDQTIQQQLHWPQQLLWLILRCYVALVFFRSGLVKIQSWDSTVELFAYEYAVPLLTPLLAAYLSAAVELILPPLLALGILTRPCALILFIFNVVAVLSYPDISPAGIKDHQLWGLILLLISLSGAGTLSMSRLLQYVFRPSNQTGSAA